MLWCYVRQQRLRKAVSAIVVHVWQRREEVVKAMVPHPMVPHPMEVTEAVGKMVPCPTGMLEGGDVCPLVE